MGDGVACGTIPPSLDHLQLMLKQDAVLAREDIRVLITSDFEDPHSSQTPPYPNVEIRSSLLT